MIDLREIRSVTEFQRNVKEYVGQLKTTKTPMVLTVNGKAELVVQNAGSYQELLDRLEHAEAIAGIRQAMAEFERGEGQPARTALEALRGKLNKPVRVIQTISDGAY